MKKKIMLLPLVAFAMVACSGQGATSGSGLHQSSEPVSQPSTPAETEGDGLSVATAFTVAQALAKMKAAGSGVVVDNKEYYVKGTFDAGTTVNATYHQWYGTVGDFKVSGATNDSGVTVAETDGGMDGKSFVVKGYMELYNNEYKVGYLPASASPTKSKYVPSIVSLDGQGGGTTSTPSSNPATSTPSTGGDGSSIATAMSAADAIAKMKAAGTGVVVDNKEYYVQGTFDTGTTVNATYHQWYGTVGELKISGATNDSGVTVTETDGGMDGKTFVVKGYLEEYNGEYKIGYLPASASPTGSKYVPSIVKLDGQGGETTSSTPSSNPGSITPATGETWVTYDFSSLTRKAGSGDNGRLSATELQGDFDACASASGKVTVTGENVYQGYVPNADDASAYKAGVDGCLRMGGSSKNGVLKLTVSEAVTGVVITAKAWKDGDLVSVNEGADATLSYGSYGELSFGVSGTTVTIKTTYRAFIEKIQLLK